MDECPRVAVIGLGALGLVALKNCGCYTDFPFPEDIPSQCTAKDVEDYLESYVDHFKLRPFIRLNTKVSHVRRDDEADKWVVEIRGSREIFDKVIIATGMNQTPSYPNIKDIELFGGEQVHSKTYKRPEAFAGKRVLVVGLGNSGADTAVSLIGQASKIYLSHRDGAIILPRAQNGKPIDHTVNVRFMTIQGIIESIFPRVAERLFNIFAKKLQDTTFTIRPEWKLSPAPSMRRTFPVVSDEIVPALERGDVESVTGVDQITGRDEVQLTDGRVLGVDAIVYCTGYKTDFGILDPEADPTRRENPAWLAAKGSRGKPLPRLYRNVFSEEYPESLAFMGCVAFPIGAFQMYDLAAMAIAQVWKGNSTLPPRREIERAIDEHQAWLVDLARTGNVMYHFVNGIEWTDWADRMAGSGVRENLGWGWKGLKFWYREPRFCGLLMGGIYSPHIFRYFDGKRKKWNGARKEIERLNAVDSDKPKTA
ncbi:dimethylaniline monooxygenase 2 [Colletotrichum karsti]|uniref:Dimethylaniline monooxygenase 2 n=1 Tax=Colletotrichum karsti TaxID=1095194 RepID=A0A9P6LG48_9PEZI|nr:dimethylaniline monooxygenase 2 [Colletotrichum karsti]KAF9871816.1 dimethylaniline monooxygenase 2 [Colletotrichum karsti]